MRRASWHAPARHSPSISWTITASSLGGAIVAGYHAMLGGLAGNTAALSVDGDWAAQTDQHPRCACYRCH